MEMNKIRYVLGEIFRNPKALFLLAVFVFVVSGAYLGFPVQPLDGDEPPSVPEPPEPTPLSF